MLLWICFAGYLALMIFAALEDARARRIPNWLTGGLVALYPLYVLTSPVPVAWPGALGAALAVFLLGWLLFARGVMGGGDVKLISAAVLWAGLDHLVLFAIVTSLAGGVLALGSLFRARYAWFYILPLARLGLVTGRGTRPMPEEQEGAPEAAGRSLDDTLPYGVAVAAGGLAVAFTLM